MKLRSALLVVDLQVDFCPGGNLAVPGGDAIIPVINRYIELFQGKGLPVFFSRDWHPPVTGHFRQFGGIWPPHCVQGSAGARFHPALHLPAGATVVSKGMDPENDDYSAFQAMTDRGESFPDVLHGLAVERLYIGGLATDYCVRASALEGLKQGFAVKILTDAVKGVNLQPGDSERALEEIIQAGGELVDLTVVAARLKA